MTGLIQTRLTQLAIRDRQIQSRYKRKQNKVYRRFGAIFRRGVRNKLRRKGRLGERSLPGNAPFTKSPEPNFRTVLYGLDSRRLVAGPIGLNSGSQEEGPQLAENGGYFRRFGKLFRYAARPFVNPTFVEKVPLLFESIKKTGLV